MTAATRFEQFVCSFKEPLVGLLFRVLQNDQEAEELAQEAFLTLYRPKVDFSDTGNCVEATYRREFGYESRPPHRAGGFVGNCRGHRGSACPDSLRYRLIGGRWLMNYDLSHCGAERPVLRPAAFERTYE